MDLRGGLRASCGRAVILLAVATTVAAGLVACRRPATEPPPPSAIPVPDAAPAPAWKVERVEREPVARFDVQGWVVDVYDDHSALALVEHPARISRHDTDGTVRWSTALQGYLQIADSLIEGQDTWILASTETNLAVTRTIRWSMPADWSVTHPMVFLRLDSESGAVKHAAIMADRNYGPRRMIRSGPGFIVATSVDSFDLELATYDETGVRQRAISLPATKLEAAAPSPDGGICTIVRPLVRDDPAREMPERYHRCFDSALRSTRTATLPQEALTFWTSGAAIEGRIEQRSPHGYELHVLLPHRPDLVIESICRVWDTIGPHEAFALLDKDGQFPDPDLGCEDTNVHLYARFADAASKAVALGVEADVAIAGHRVPVSAPSLLLLRIEQDDTITYSLHPKVFRILSFRGHLAMAHHARATQNYVLFDLSSR